MFCSVNFFWHYFFVRRKLRRKVRQFVRPSWRWWKKGFDLFLQLWLGTFCSVSFFWHYYFVFQEIRFGFRRLFFLLALVWRLWVAATGCRGALSPLDDFPEDSAIFFRDVATAQWQLRFR